MEALVALGFTALEAEVYTFLLKESPATGYRVAQALGRPVAGVYKALDALIQQGALVADEGASRLCRAVPPEELLSRLERSFRERKVAAERALAELSGTRNDDRVYQLHSYDQVLERARAMLARAETVALIDSFPGTLEELRPELEATAARGVSVGVQTYSPMELGAARVTLFPPNDFVRSFPREWLLAVVDGAELLQAFFDRPERRIEQAIWSGSPFLAFTLQAFMTSEFTFIAAMGDPDMPAAAREVVRRHGGHFPFRHRGYELLLRRFGAREILPERPD